MSLLWWYAPPHFHLLECLQKQNPTTCEKLHVQSECDKQGTSCFMICI